VISPHAGEMSGRTEGGREGTKTLPTPIPPTNPTI
jgi:hypothetical protein